MAYTVEEVVCLFEADGSALDTMCMVGSDDELGFDEVEAEVVANPYTTITQANLTILRNLKVFYVYKLEKNIVCK